MSFQRKMIVITPMCCLFCYLLIGFTIGQGYFSGNPNTAAWGWGLLVFLLVPLMPYIVGTKKIVFTVTLVVTLIYVALCSVWQIFNPAKPIWHPAWIIFILIPVIKVLALPNEEEAKKKVKEKAEKMANNNSSTKSNDDDDDQVYDAK